VSAEVGPHDRGTTDIAGRVVERIATHALTEVGAVAGTPRRLLGRPLGREPAARASAWVDDGLATVTVRVGVVYPAPVREVSRRLREHVRATVERLTGLDVRQIDVEITRLPPPEPTSGRVS
jgi:uncharacterized alkaline shock family protein YloU